MSTTFPLSFTGRAVVICKNSSVIQRLAGERRLIVTLVHEQRGRLDLNAKTPTALVRRALFTSVSGRARLYALWMPRKCAALNIKPTGRAAGSALQIWLVFMMRSVLLT